MPTLTRERARLLLAIALVVPFGFILKFRVPGCVGHWCNLYGAAVLYEVFWILAIRLVWPRLSPLVCGGAVFSVTCLLEFAQLWHPPLLEAVRATFLGAALLGTSFDPWDFAYYALGSALGVWLNGALRDRNATNPAAGSGSTADGDVDDVGTPENP